MTPLSVIILTRDEEIHIARAIRSLTPLVVEIFVVDSFSTDQTVEIACSLNAHVVQHEFVNYAQQFQWALENLPIKTEWVMRLDADEILTPELVDEIARRMPELPAHTTGVVLKLGYIFMGRKIAHGGRWLRLLRIFRKSAAHIEQRWMDEHMVVRYGKTVIFENNMFDSNIKNLTFFTDKHNKYATREAIDILNRKYKVFEINHASDEERTSLQLLTKRWIKENIYNRLPFWLGPVSYFLFRYFLLLGFLDGREGLIYHFLQGFWYRFLVGAKVEEFDRSLCVLPDQRSRLVELERLTGYNISENS
ncbi:MAG: glycosyltransferase family 2 protein [Candidatus Binataceae bacterium]|jgi:glycosyltransferase involved in cell wall biosynthesis